MKRYNRCSLSGVVLLSLCLIAGFCFAVSSVLAYFTATALQSNANLTTAIVRLTLSDVTGNGVAMDDYVITMSEVLPGDDITLEGTITNSGTEELWTMLEVSFTITDGTTTDEASTTYYTIDGSAQITMSNNTYTTTGDKQTLTKGSSTTFSVTKTISVDLGNSYQGTSQLSNMVVVVLGIQKANIDTFSLAVEKMISVRSTLEL